MIQVDDLTISYAGHSLFEKVCLTIQKKEKCGLIGRNGSGKSTFFRLLTQKELPDHGRIVLPKGYQLGYLDQHIHFTKSTILEEAILGLPPEKQEEIYRAEKILFGLGFSKEQFDFSPRDLSGGFQLRLHLAKVLLSEPDCLLLDEPSNYLDILSIRWLTRFLRQWEKEFILITHDREFMDTVCTHTIGIHRKKMKKIKGSTIDFFDQLIEEEKIYESTRMNQEKKREHLQSFIDRFGAKATKAAQAKSRQKTLNRLPTMEKLKNLYDLSFSFNETPFMGKKLLDAKNLFFSYSPETPLIQNISLEIEKGEKIAIIGKNGKGKSTLLKLLAGEMDPIQGELHQSDQTQIGYFGQTNIDRLHQDASIEEEIALSNPNLNTTQVKNICGLMMFGQDLSKKPISVLSGGERSRVLLGKILAKPCNLLFLDEPTHHLDMESIEALIDAIEDFSGALLLVTHSELILKRIAFDKILICSEQKQELFLGNYEEFLEKKGWEEEKNEKSKHSPFQEGKTRQKEVIQERSKLLKPLKKQIDLCEKRIITLEEDQEKDQRKLSLELEEKRPPPLFLLKQMGERQKQIELLFEELENLNNTYQFHLKNEN